MEFWMCSLVFVCSLEVLWSLSSCLFSRFAGVQNLVAPIRFFLFTCCFRLFFGVHSRFLSATRTLNSHSYFHYSLSQFTGEWFTNHSNHTHIFTPISRTVVTKVQKEQRVLAVLFLFPESLPRKPKRQRTMETVRRCNFLGRAKGQNVPQSKTSRGWPVGSHFSRPSETGSEVVS